MAFFKSVTIASGVVAGLSLLALPMWALGVPGVENDYARGWKMGLNVLLVYPPAWLLTYLPYFVMRNRLSDANRQSRQAVTGSFACIIFVAAAARMIQAFKIMA